MTGNFQNNHAPCTGNTSPFLQVLWDCMCVYIVLYRLYRYISIRYSIYYTGNGGGKWSGYWYLGCTWRSTVVADGIVDRDVDRVAEVPSIITDADRVDQCWRSLDDGAEIIVLVDVREVGVVAEVGQRLRWKAAGCRSEREQWGIGEVGFLCIVDLSKDEHITLE